MSKKYSLPREGSLEKAKVLSDDDVSADCHYIYAVYM